VDEPGSLKRIKLDKGKKVEGLERANTDITMNVICFDKDNPIVEFTGAAIENEQVNEPVGESAGQKEQE